MVEAFVAEAVVDAIMFEECGGTSIGPTMTQVEVEVMRALGKEVVKEHQAMLHILAGARSGGSEGDHSGAGQREAMSMSELVAKEGMETANLQTEIDDEHHHHGKHPGHGHGHGHHATVSGLHKHHHHGSQAQAKVQRVATLIGRFQADASKKKNKNVTFASAGPSPSGGEGDAVKALMQAQKLGAGSPKPPDSLTARRRPSSAAASSSSPRTTFRGRTESVHQAEHGAISAAKMADFNVPKSVMCQRPRMSDFHRTTLRETQEELSRTTAARSAVSVSSFMNLRN